MLIFYLSLSIGVSFLCSMFEAVILSISPAYTATLRKSGTKASMLLDDLKSNIDDSLSAILTLNTVAHTIGAAGVGAEVLKLFGDKYVALGSVILTILILVLSEIIPKTIGATYNRQLSTFAAYGIQLFIYLTYPFVKVFKVLAKIIGSDGAGHGGIVTREELVHNAEMGQQSGKLTDDELAVIKNLLKLKSLTANSVMTPRTVVFSLDESLTVNQLFSENEKLNFTRIPVYNGDRDYVTGLVNRYDLVEALAKGGGDKTLAEFKTDVRTISDKMSLGEVFETFKSTNEHLFLVNDEHGGFDGVITLEDVVETLLGFEITDEFDNIEDMRVYAAELWQERKDK